MRFAWKKKYKNLVKRWVNPKSQISVSSTNSTTAGIKRENQLDREHATPAQHGMKEQKKTWTNTMIFRTKRILDQKLYYFILCESQIVESEEKI